MSASIDALFKPFESERLSLPNRFAMAPMTRSMSPEGVPGADVAAYYRKRAENGVSLIITEGTTINDGGASFDAAVPNFHDAASLKGWGNVVKEVHKAGGKIVPQLWHVGIMRKQGTGPNPDARSASPSGLLAPGKKVAEPVTAEEVDQLIAAFANAAADAKNLGFDGVELHGAHGYLIDQFFWEGTNIRDDRWGSDRTAFACEIVKAVREALGPDLPIILRYSQWKQTDFGARLALTPEALEAFLAPLADAGVDIFHCSTRRYWEPEFEGSDLNLAGWTKKLTGKPTITVGSIGLNKEFIETFAGASSPPAADISNLLERLEKDEFDLVAVGRALISNPDFVAMIKEGRLSEMRDYDPAELVQLV